MPYGLFVRAGSPCGDTSREEQLNTDQVLQVIRTILPARNMVHVAQNAHVCWVHNLGSVRDRSSVSVKGLSRAQPRLSRSADARLF